ncbi:MAG: sulfotransferase domain-containing protein [Bacteroidetes bacterium]|nr:sulfotransferase domain-containing protein [Bacteroidota bacterium]
MRFFKKKTTPYNIQFNHPHRDGTKEDYQKFILLTYPRSGSYFFTDLLRSHTNIVAFGGLYGPGKIGFLYPGYPDVSCRQTIEHRDRDTVAFLQKHIFTPFAENIGAVGFKAPHQEQYRSVLTHLESYPDLKVINLHRKNMLDVYISNVIANTTQKWHAWSKENVDYVETIGAIQRVRIVEDVSKPILPDDFSISLDFDQVLHGLRSNKEAIQEFETFFNDERKLIVFYEDLIKDKIGEVNRVLEFLNVDSQELTSRFLKINTRKKSEIISNYEELRRKFAGTEWIEFFDE